MNCAFFIDNFKGVSGRTYLINGDINALIWLSDKFRHVLSATANSNVRIGDGNPFESHSGIFYIVIDNSLTDRSFRLIDNNNYYLAVSRDDLVELSGKIDGMIELGKPAHNYLRIGLDELSRIFITTGEYSDSLLIKMAREEESPNLGKAR